MADEKFLVTKEGLDELLKEQDNLIHVVRDEVIRELQEARAQGDLARMRIMMLPVTVRRV